MNKEFGSDFHKCSNPEFILNSNQKSFFNDKDFSFFISGRSALHALLKQGISNFNWKKVYIPSYYCQDVIENLHELSIEIIVFDFNPNNTYLNPSFFEDKPENVFINVSYYGVTTADVSFFKKIIIIDDLTHDLLSIKKSAADYVFASLRKQLPVPLGGVVYSSKKKCLPKGVKDEEGNKAAEYKTLGMFLKSEYLVNRFSNKELFRDYYAIAEEKLISLHKDFSLPILAKNILNQLDVEKIIRKKEENLKLSLDLLTGFKTCLINTAKTSLGLLFLFNSNFEREYIKKSLIKANIYPAVLWPNQKNEQDISYQNRFLFLHVDYRYSKEDIKYITQELKKAILECQKQKL